MKDNRDVWHEKLYPFIDEKNLEEFFWDNIIVGLLPQAKGSILSIGFVMSIYFASNGLLALMQGFDKTYNSSFRKRSWWEKELVAYFLTFLLALLFII